MIIDVDIHTPITILVHQSLSTRKFVYFSFITNSERSFVYILHDSLYYRDEERKNYNIMHQSYTCALLTIAHFHVHVNNKQSISAAV